jgi:hypothetical protein
MDEVRARQRETSKLYYERNKEKILEKRREKYHQQKTTKPTEAGKKGSADRPE